MIEKDDRMKNKDLDFDRKSHVLYSKQCEKLIRERIECHFPDNVEEMWTQVQLQYVSYLKDWRTDLGGKKNFHNGLGGTYDNIAILSYYSVCKEVSSFKEIEKMMEDLILPTFQKLRFVDFNHRIYKKLMYIAFQKSKKKCDKYMDYDMRIDPYDKDKPIYYEFRTCPVAEFAKKNGLKDIVPSLCNVDYKCMEVMHATLIRKTTCVSGDKCDYMICQNKDKEIKEHPEYIDVDGSRRNK